LVHVVASPWRHGDGDMFLTMREATRTGSKVAGSACQSVEVVLEILALIFLDLVALLLVIVTASRLR
jgi:hypothetical protein